MIWLFYNILFPVVFLLMTPHFLWRMWKRGGYRNGFRQRFGIYELEFRERLRSRRRIWIHAVSVGEVFIALRFMEEARVRRPESAFVLTTTTSTGHAVAARGAGSDDVVMYFPLDLPPVMRSVFKLLDPEALVVVECELWPNLVRIAAARKIPVVLLNGRISERSYRGYSRMRPWVRDVLRCFDLLCAQDEVNAERLRRLGADPAKVKVAGSAKYDVARDFSKEIEEAGAGLVARAFGPGVRVLVGGSTWPGEESVLLDVYKTLRERHGNARLVLAPRHAERASEVIREIGRSGFQAVLRSELLRERAGAPPDVLLVDTTGELRAFYSVATLIFVGKSLASRGGQNIIEPAVFAKPIIVGPHMENFESVAADFLAAGAMVQVAGALELERSVLKLWNDPASRAEYGRRARQLVGKKAGSVRASVDFLFNLRTLAA